MPSPLAELASVFFRLGATSFGGPAAHLAVLRRELVERRRWLDEGRFLDLISAANLIPGPTSTEVVMHVGFDRGGMAGLWVAGLAFITPAVLATAVLAAVYVEFGALPQANAALAGAKPVVVAVVVQALLALGRVALRSWMARGLWVASVGALLAGAPELAVLIGAGAFAVVLRKPAAAAAFFPAALPAPADPARSIGVVAIFLSFLKIGFVLFGSGYVLFAFLHTELVETRGWLTQAQLVDAIAVGQLTPGPLFSSATFVGYVIGGVPGALAATVGIFLPAFLLVGITGPRLAGLRASPLAAPFLDGVNAASLALMAVVTWELGVAAFADVRSLAIGGAAIVLLARSTVNPAWLILAGALVGWAWVG